MTVYMAIDLDYYELPIAIADTITELAQRLGVSRSTISASMHQSRRCGCRSRYVKVEIEDD